MNCCRAHILNVPLRFTESESHVLKAAASDHCDPALMEACRLLTLELSNRERGGSREEQKIKIGSFTHRAKGLLPEKST